MYFAYFTSAHCDSFSRVTYELAAEHVSKKKIGTVFGGTAEVGVKIEDLMKRESKL